METVRSLQNVGPKTAQWLEMIGITTVDQLRAIGSVMAFVMIRDSSVGPSLNLLYALESGLQGRHWLSLTEQEKAELREQVPPFHE